MRPREPYTLYSRPNRKGERIWYWRSTTDSGRSSGKSTGRTSKTAARTYVVDLLRKDALTDKDPTFGAYAEGWWDWDQCRYVRGKRARGKRISQGYVAIRRGYLQAHILPAFKDRRVSTITAGEIEDWLMGLRSKVGRYGKPLSAMTINMVLETLKLMFKEGVRKGELPYNPAATVEPLAENRAERGVLEPQEIRALFDRDKLAEVWRGDFKHYVLNMLACSTGMRLGECQALANNCIFDGYVDVRRSWARKYGFKEPKLGSFRKIPLPTRTLACLRELQALSPFQDPEDLVFWGPDRQVPVDHKTVAEVFYTALAKIEISAEARKERRISFHSHRHFFNTYCRTKIPDVKLRLLTGHKSEAMSDLYTHFSVRDFADVVRIQERIFQGESDGTEV